MAAKPAQRRHPGLTRARVNLVLDAVLLLWFAALCYVAVVTRFVFPAATAEKGWRLWGWSLDGWLALEFNLVAGLALLVLLHVMLHWSWVCNVTSDWLSRRNGPTSEQDLDQPAAQPVKPTKPASAAQRGPKTPARANGRAAAGRPDDGLRTIYGVGLLIVLVNLLGLLTAAAVLSIKQLPP